MHRRVLSCILIPALLTASMLLTANAQAAPEEAKPDVPKPAGDNAVVEPVKAEPVAKTPEPARACECPKAATPRVPIFIADFGHLAELTKSDPDVLARAELMERRQHGASLMANLGIGMGLGMLGLGVVDRAAAGEWRKGMDWIAISGAVVAVLAAVTAWNYAPDHGDMADAINLWNRRHPDKPLAP